MRKRVAIHGATEEALRLVPLIERDPDLELGVVFDEDPEAARARWTRIDRERAAALGHLVTGDPEALGPAARIHTVVDGARRFAREHPPRERGDLRVLSPLSARLLWTPSDRDPARRRDLIAALRDVVDSVDWLTDPELVAERVLEVAIGALRADAGSVMLLEPETEQLTIRAAVGIEAELWDKIRVPLGSGIAGRAAAEGTAVRVAGPADAARFQVLRERHDVAAAVSVPLVHEGRLLGVLNCSHHADPEAFPEHDLGFVEQLAALAGSLLARAGEEEDVRDQAGRYDAVHELHAILGDRTALLEHRLARMCRALARRVGAGIVTLYLYDCDEAVLRMEATSLSGGGFGSDYRVEPGQGIDGGAARERKPALLRRTDGRLAYAALPLVAEGELVGLLSIQAGERAHHLGRAAERTLEAVAAAVAAEVATAEREARLETRTLRSQALGELALQMLRIEEPNEVVRLAAGSTAMILECDHVILRLRDETTGRFMIRSYCGPADGDQQRRLFHLDQRLGAEVAKARSPSRLRDVEQDDVNRRIGAGVRSALAAPLLRAGRAIGTLAVYDKVPSGRFQSQAFGEADQELLVRLAAYVERALVHAEVRSWARRHPAPDPETELESAVFLRRRIAEELARLAARDPAPTASARLVVGTCRLEAAAAPEGAARPEQATRTVQRVADALRACARPFDVVARTGESSFGFLLPEPGPQGVEGVPALARRVVERVCRDDAVPDAAHAGLAFGYASYPEDGADADALLEAASRPRIKML